MLSLNVTYNYGNFGTFKFAKKGERPINDPLIRCNLRAVDLCDHM